MNRFLFLIICFSISVTLGCSKKTEVSGTYVAKMAGSEHEFLVLEFKPDNKVLLTESGIVRGEKDYTVNGDIVEIDLARPMNFRMQGNTLTLEGSDTNLVSAIPVVLTKK